ncbi:MAG: hypothetical protein GXX07_09280 [Wolinella succinogenes]|uniref:hypothetical protein n=1 Tax=Wolinella succinogenes TaxID=844 RepID=UPI0016B9E478|nr:hypothetical protein [Wolinella succinogenes]NLU35149.1 hypothetical protein [Wolinella succinogenes]
MPDTITVKIKNSQPCNYALHGAPIVLQEGDNLVRIDHWLIIKDLMKKKISRGFVSVDLNEESRAIESYKQKCFLEFELLGIPSVKVSSEKGDLSTGVKHLLALEWLMSKEALREENRDSREIESISIARSALKVSKWSIVLSIITAVVVAIITAWATVKFGN